MATTPKFRIPKRIGTCADRIYKLKQEKAEAQKVVDKIDAEIKALKNHVIETLPKSNASGVAGKLARVSVVTKEKPQVKDWDAFYKHISRTKSWDLLQRRVGETAVKARWEAGKKVPGVETFQVVDISLNKL